MDDAKPGQHRLLPSPPEQVLLAARGRGRWRLRAGKRRHGWAAGEGRAGRLGGRAVDHRALGDVRSPAAVEGAASVGEGRGIGRQHHGADLVVP